MPNRNPNENAESCDADRLAQAADILASAVRRLTAAARLSAEAAELCTSDEAVDEDGNPHPETLAALYSTERGLFPRCGEMRDKAEAELLKAANILADLKEHA